jgi:uncharacterized protein YcnI
MARSCCALIGAGILAIGTGGSASAHVTLETAQAPPNSTYKAVLRVPHGCEGSPTVAVRVKIPEGVIAVKPMPKPGWELATTTAKYGKTYDYYGTPLTEGVTEIAWTDGNLPDAWYDEFVFRAALTDFPVGSSVYFPVVQECPDGKVERWIDIPAAGQSDDDLETPAPGLSITEKKAGND